MTMAWKKYCHDYNSGGFSLKSLRLINDVGNLVQCWLVINSYEPWALVLCDIIFRNDRLVNYHVFSSV